MLKFFKWLFLVPPAPVKRKRKKPSNEIAIRTDKYTDQWVAAKSLTKLTREINQRVFQRYAVDDVVFPPGTTMDAINVAMDDINSVKSVFSLSNQQVSIIQLDWYSAQGFIGYQVCATMGQQWLIDKSCHMPAQDAVRKGYKANVVDAQVNSKVLKHIYKLDKKYRLKQNLVEFVSMGRLFGIRIALFKIESDDPDFYVKPFNIDGVTPGSYKGISQIDPYWITPELSFQAASDPSAMDFYEPTWWRINGKRYHRSHLIIMRNSENLADVLKPTYFYGGISIPQKVYERVYCAERTANEAPHLAQTKRMVVQKVDLKAMVADQAAFEQQAQTDMYFRDNYSTKFIGEKEELMQLDTALADFDTVVTSQYKLVSAIVEVPIKKLMGESPQGLNATGGYDEASYHEMLESLQSDYCSPLAERHHMLLIKSEVAPHFGIEYFETETIWNKLDAMTEKELSETNAKKAETGERLIMAGAIDGQEERKRLMTEPDSGYAGFLEERPIEDPRLDLFNDNPNDPSFIDDGQTTDPLDELKRIAQQ